MIARIETIPEKKLVGMRLKMSFANDQTFTLWNRFMPNRKKIANALSADLFCIQVYEPLFDVNSFSARMVFEKWAAMEVSGFAPVPEHMEPFIIPEGLYAVFLHKGAAITGAATFRAIFETWLPASGYALDHRPHFEIMGEKYKNNDPDSEEDIWIPIRPK